MRDIRIECRMRRPSESTAWGMLGSVTMSLIRVGKGMVNKGTANSHVAPNPVNK
jgi:hypothetical protein